MAEVTPTISRGGLSFEITGQVSHAATAAGSLAYFQNPEDCPIVIKSCMVYGVTNSTSACNLTIGHATTVIGGHDTAQLFAAAAQADSHGTAVTGFANGDAADSLPVVPTDSYICAWASADSSGLEAIAYIDYVRAEEFTA
jgi:hypothetical protein